MWGAGEATGAVRCHPVYLLRSMNCGGAVMFVTLVGWLRVAAAHVSFLSVDVWHAGGVLRGGSRGSERCCLRVRRSVYHRWCQLICLLIMHVGSMSRGRST